MTPLNQNPIAGGAQPRLVTAALFAVIVSALMAGCGQRQPPVIPPMEVAVVELEAEDIPLYLDMIGQTLGSVDIPIRARVDGVLEEIHFLEGREVSKGQLLYVIDPLPYQTRVVEAEGRLAEARTQLAKAESDLQRIRPLAEMDAVSQQDLDSAVAQFEAAQGTLQAAEAQLKQANIELSYTRITAPVDGSISITEARVGEYVGREPNPVVLNVVSRTDPIRVRFSINEREYLRFSREIAQGIRSEEPTNDPQASQLQLILADGELYEHRGRIVSFDAAIDPNTGTLTLEADFPNPDRIVLPGQFARVRGAVDVRRNAVAVPQRAVIELQGLYQVAVVDADGTVEVRSVEMGPRVDNRWIVDAGLAPGERIALEGLQRLQTGATVVARVEESDESGSSQGPM